MGGMTINSLLAQLVEQMTVNHWVRGSSPRQGANISRELEESFQRLESLDEVLAGRPETNITTRVRVAPVKRSLPLWKGG